MAAFQDGDVVVLKSGGPKMTVVSTEGTSVKCQWFDASKKHETGSFAEATLKKVEPRGPSVIVGRRGSPLGWPNR